MSRRRRFGKYRGTVINNVDPERMGRLQLVVPDVYGTEPTPWAMPCTPVAAPEGGMMAIPPIGAAVWVEFERGEDQLPIWVGGFWPTGVNFAPPVAPSSLCITLQTPGGYSLIVSDAPGAEGGITLRTTTGAALILNDTGIHITNGKGASVTMVGPTVSVNNGALEVT